MGNLGILYYVGSFPKLSESFILNEIVELDKRGYNIAVFSLQEPQNEDISHNELTELDIPVLYSDQSYRTVVDIFSSEFLTMAYQSFNLSGRWNLSSKEIGYYILGKQCSNFINNLDFDIDIIHGHFASPSRLGMIYAANFFDIPCTVTAHAVEIFRQPNHEMIRRVCENVNHIIVPSQYNKKYLKKKVEVSTGISVVPATTEVRKFDVNYETKNNRLLTVGRLVEKKGHKYAIEAVEKLVNRGYEIQYHIVGDGNHQPEIKEQILELKLEDNIELLGKIPDERLCKEYSEACVFVLPCVIAKDGDRDAMPVVLKEAMAAESACVSTNISAIPELISSGHNGELVPPNDSEKLADSIQNILDNKRYQQQLGRNGKKTVKNDFDISISVTKLIKTFNKQIK